jgi:hypothetical protein
MARPKGKASAATKKTTKQPKAAPVAVEAAPERDPPRRVEKTAQVEVFLHSAKLFDATGRELGGFEFKTREKCQKKPILEKLTEYLRGSHPVADGQEIIMDRHNEPTKIAPWYL